MPVIKKPLGETTPSKDKLDIAFIHPDLGIGGAERLVVDAAMGLQNLNHNIHIYTSHCDKSHCFEEVGSGELEVSVYGDFFPTKIAGKLHILFAILRQFYLTIKLIFTGEILKYDYFIVDQLSFCVPLLVLFARENARVLFYCHFPDQLLAQRGSVVKKLYRQPFDALEQWTTGISDRIVVNSNFTKSMFHKTFSQLSWVDPGVIYPCVDLASAAVDPEADLEVKEFLTSEFFLSVNRFERKKNIELAISLFAKFKSEFHKRGESPSARSKPRLVIAGGFDARVSENVEYLRELTHLAESLHLNAFTIRGKLLTLPPSTDILFLPSIKSSIKTSLIKQCELLLYTPSFEHFGIVPVESMLCQTPVLGANNGGPLESIVNYDFTLATRDSATGYICEPTLEKWGNILIKHYFEVDPSTKEQLGTNGIARVEKIFLRDEMSRAFMDNLNKTATRPNKGKLFTILLFWQLEAVVLISGIVLAMYKR